MKILTILFLYITSLNASVAEFHFTGCDKETGKVEPAFFYEGHLWYPTVMFQHHPDCSCHDIKFPLNDESKEGEPTPSISTVFVESVTVV